jgi:adenosylhomocysteine nucleosidase
MGTSEVETWLLVAAESREFDGLRRELGSGRELNWPLDFARAVQGRGRRWILAANGPGPARAAEAVRVSLARERAGRVISTGYCGGLAGDLAVGEVVAAEAVRGEDGEFAADPPRGAARRGPVLSLDRVAVTAAEKRRLAEDGAIAVEMEAAAVAREARCAGIPFACVRAVSDAAGEDLPLDFNRFRGPDGRFARARIAAATLADPRLAAKLWALHRNARIAGEALGRYLANCEF